MSETISGSATGKTKEAVDGSNASDTDESSGSQDVDSKQAAGQASDTRDMGAPGSLLPAGDAQDRGAQKHGHAIGKPGKPAEAGSGLPERSRPVLINRLARIFGYAQTGDLRNDLAEALKSADETNAVFSPGERAMLNNILRLRELRVEDVMVPRVDIEAIDQSVTIGELMAYFEESGRSRMPVYNEHLDDPRGMVHIRDLLTYITKQAKSRRKNDVRPAASSANGTGKTKSSGASSSANAKSRRFDLARVDLDKTVVEAGIVRKILFVPPSMLASDLMARMQAVRMQMALVIDEYGGTDGLVSLEDIVEMVVGDIEDEHDDEETMITKTSDDVFLVDAKAELTDIVEVVGPDFDIEDKIEDVDTLGGLIFSALGRVPARGELVQAIPGFEFHVLDADPRRIKRVRIVRRRPANRRRPHAVRSESPAGSIATGAQDRSAGEA